MPSSPLSVIVQQLRAAAERDGVGRTDGELLSRFLSHRDDVALGALVERHAPMVWGVCRRLLRNPHDAEDAFQATFLLLVRKAGAVAPREKVGNWLYGVAQQTALRLRAMAAKRSMREMQMKEMPEPIVAEARDDTFLLLLDQELSRLPERFRALIVLCDLEGNSRKEVARQLGCPEGTVASGLARARELLAKRLTRRGLVISGGSLAAALSHSVASAGVPTTVVTSTIKIATLLAAGNAVGVISGPVAALIEGALKAMLMSKLMAAAAVVLVLGVMAVGAVSLLQQPSIEKEAVLPVKKEDNATAGPAADTLKDETAKKELAKLQGTWTAISVERDGKTLSEEEVNKLDIRLTIEGNEFMLMPLASIGPEHFPHGNFLIDPSKNPKTLDLTVNLPFLLDKKTSTVLSIYELDGDNLKLLQGRPDQQRPTEFKTTPKSDLEIIVFKRVISTPAAQGDKPPVEGDKPHIVEKNDMKGRIEFHLPEKVERVGGEPTQEDVMIASKKFFSKMLTYPDIRFREFFDPRYLKKHGLTDRDIAFEAVSGGGIHNIVVADDNRTVLCILEFKGVREAFVLRWVLVEGNLYVSPEKAPDPKTGIFTPWILRTQP